MEKNDGFTLHNNCASEIEVDQQSIKSHGNKGLSYNKNYTVSWTNGKPNKKFSYNMTVGTTIKIEIKGQEKINLEAICKTSSGHPTEPNDTITIEDNEE